MTQEEKAKRYDEAIEKGKQIQNTPYTAHWDIMKEVAEHLLPELKESEDERIRKEIISAIKEDWPGHKDWIAWLEKHGEQKPTNNIEPKFKVGDWISGYYTNYKVLSVNNEGYVVEDVDGNKINILFENEKFHHLWTIQDAKNGDVLVHNNCVFIFMGIKNGIVQAIEENFLKPVSFGEPDKDNDYYPATKEQRDLLLQKIKKAGYEWNADKKELKKVEQKPVDINPSEFDSRLNALLKQFESLPKEELVNSLSFYLNVIQNDGTYKEQKPVKWSKEDLSMIGRIRSIIEKYAFSQSAVDVNGELCEKEFIDADNWLKSLEEKDLL